MDDFLYDLSEEVAPSDDFIAHANRVMTRIFTTLQLSYVSCSTILWKNFILYIDIYLIYTYGGILWAIGYKVLSPPLCSFPVVGHRDFIIYSALS